MRQHGVRIRDDKAVLASLEDAQTHNVGFADTYLAASAAEEKLALASFDRDFDKLSLARYESKA